MPYNSSGLSIIAYANDFTLWHYRTTDSAEDVASQGYFNAAKEMLCSGDFLFVNTSVDTAPTHGVIVVTSNHESGAVEVDYAAFNAGKAGAAP